MYTMCVCVCTCVCARVCAVVHSAFTGYYLVDFPFDPILHNIMFLCSVKGNLVSNYL